MPTELSPIKFALPENPTRVAIMGDWHADAYFAELIIEAAHNLGAEIIVHTGDFGFSYHNDHHRNFISRVTRKLRKLDMVLVSVDGNHESFDYLNSLPLNADGLRPVTKHIAHLPRGFRWKWWDTTWLALGGAHSVNSHLLTPGYDWFPEELITWAQAEEVIAAGHADVMVTHDVPNKVYIQGLPGASLFPAYQINAAEEHHALLGEVVDEVRPDWLFHGHMHKRHTAQRPLRDGGETSIIGLDCNAGRGWKDAMVLLDPLLMELLPLHENIASPVELD